MKFVDEVTVKVQAGKGGDGCLSFHRGRNLAKGGPDGGDGGQGGDVHLIANRALNTLVDFRFHPLLRAENGSRGGNAEKTGARGKGLDVLVPVGTTVIDDETLEVLGDLTEEGESMRVAAGGALGRGNASFKSSTNRAPRRTTQGKLGESRRLRLQLKVIADVGLLGMPNAGKSTLISSVSASKPKIADYPFTTLIPNLGVVRVGDEASFVIADVPGLIPGASQGAGLGTRFLRHLARTRLLLHLVEVAPLDGSDPVDNAMAIEAELRAFSEGFFARPIWNVPTKIDVGRELSDGVVERLAAAFPGRPAFPISAVTGDGVDKLINAVMAHVAEFRARLEEPDESAREVEIERSIGADILRHAIAEQAERKAAADDSQTDSAEVIYRDD